MAVPANTLWPDVLRFSTDEGRCWHTVPLRTGTWNTDSTTQTATTLTTTPTTSSAENHVTTVTIRILDSGTTPPLPNVTDKTVAAKIASAALANPVNVSDPRNVSTASPSVNSSRVADTNATSAEATVIGTPSVVDSWNRARADETVVFTGLVTEPGGRAMAAAVYGYGTVSQRWRVAVVDFMNNGMVQRSCKF